MRFTLTKTELVKLLSAAKKYVVYFFLIIVFILAIFAGFALKGEVEEHTVGEYDAEEYTDLKHLNRLLLQATEYCKTEKTDEHAKACEIVLDSIMNHASLHDLAAQETVAMATRGLLRIGAYQALASFLTLAFLVWTVFITRDMRREAINSANAMTGTLEIAQNAERAHVFGMAYAEFDKIKNPNNPNIPEHDHDAGFNKGYLTYWVVIENHGQTPARNVKYSFVRDYGTKDDAYLNETREIGSLGAGEKRKIFSYTDETTGYVKITEFDRPRELKIRIAVTYTDVFGVKHGPTISNCRLQFSMQVGSTFRVLKKEEVLRATSDPSKSLGGAIYWHLHDLRDVWMRVRQTTAEERKAKRDKRKTKA